jgi:hypothetical protein
MVTKVWHMVAPLPTHGLLGLSWLGGTSGVTWHIGAPGT